MKYTLLIFTIFLCLSSFAQTDHTRPAALPGARYQATDMPMREHYLRLSQAEYLAPTAAKTTTGGPGYIFDTTRWAHLVDSTWGAGIPDTAKLKVFNTFWGQMDSFYACFVGLPMYNWDSIVAAIDTQVIHGVSRGRFAALCDHFLTYINDGHSDLNDGTIRYSTAVYPGLPVFRGESGKFGACITTWNDTSALVYAARPLHPLGLEPGDIILGYNGEPWTRLVQTILRHMLPNSVYKGSTTAATMHRYIQAVGENWYLFDTINIRKCDGSLVNLPTSLMTGVLYQDFPTEQMPVSGVHIFTYNDYYSGITSVSSGVITGKKIGYVYMYDCADASGNDLLNAVRTLVEDSMVKGLILDIRTNFGGGFGAFMSTYEYLSAAGTSWAGYGDRYDMNRYHMAITGPTTWYDVLDGDPSWFPYPIAVLTGPNAVSAGDLFPLMFKHNATTKIFGKSTAGAYGSSTSITLPYPGFYARRQEVNFFEASAPGAYITHVEVPVDSVVWFHRDSVCAGIDNIVTDAVRWIEGQIVAVDPVATPADVSISVFPNPASRYLNVSVKGVVRGDITVQLCDMLGTIVKEVHQDMTAGDNNIQISLAGMALPAGNYMLTTIDEAGHRMVKKVTIIQ